MERQLALLMADLSGHAAHSDTPDLLVNTSEVHPALELVQKSLTGQSRIVEQKGSQILIVSSRPDDLARTALTLSVYAALSFSAREIPMGLHYGTLIEAQGRYFGSDVLLATRLMAQAKEGKVLCSADFMRTLSHPDRFEYLTYGHLYHKSRSMEIFELAFEQAGESTSIGQGPHITPILQHAGEQEHFELNGKMFLVYSDRHLRKIGESFLNQLRDAS